MKLGTDRICAWIGIVAVGCGGTVASVSADRGDAAAGPVDGSADAPGPTAARADAAVAPDATASSDASAGEDAGPNDASGDAKVSACEACLTSHCGPSYAECRASNACVKQLTDTILCRTPVQDEVPGELILCLANSCRACDCHP